LAKFSGRRGGPPATIIARIDRPVNAPQLVVDSIYVKKLSRTLFETSALFDGKLPFCVFEPPFGGLQVTYAVHLMLWEGLC